VTVSFSRKTLLHEDPEGICYLVLCDIERNPVTVGTQIVVSDD
jgi:hypothetical protein